MVPESSGQWVGEICKDDDFVVRFRPQTFGIFGEENMRCAGNFFQITFCFLKAIFGKDHVRSFLQDDLESLGFLLCEFNKVDPLHFDGAAPV